MSRKEKSGYSGMSVEERIEHAKTRLVLFVESYFKEWGLPVKSRILSCNFGRAIGKLTYYEVEIDKLCDEERLGRAILMDGATVFFPGNYWFSLNDLERTKVLAEYLEYKASQTEKTKINKIKILDKVKGTHKTGVSEERFDHESEPDYMSQIAKGTEDY